MPQMLIIDLKEGAGLALDVKGGRIFVRDLGGSVCSANPDGSEPKTLLNAEGNLRGIAYAELSDVVVSGTQRSLRQGT